MGFVLIDADNQDHEFTVNSWHWHTILQLLLDLDLLSEEDLEWMSFNGTPCVLEHDRSRQIAQTLRRVVLPVLQKGQRIELNGQLTMEPDNGEFYREPEEWIRNYSTNREVLEAFCKFCETCSGFHVQ